jgi:hypothetical protein
METIADVQSKLLTLYGIDSGTGELTSSGFIDSRKDEGAMEVNYERFVSASGGDPSYKIPTELTTDTSLKARFAMAAGNSGSVQALVNAHKEATSGSAKSKGEIDAIKSGVTGAEEWTVEVEMATLFTVKALQILAAPGIVSYQAGNPESPEDRMAPIDYMPAASDIRKYIRDNKVPPESYASDDVMKDDSGIIEERTETVDIGDGKTAEIKYLYPANFYDGTFCCDRQLCVKAMSVVLGSIWDAVGGTLLQNYMCGSMINIIASALEIVKGSDNMEKPTLPSP